MSGILPIEISAQGVAWYGAIVATFGFIMSLYNIMRDQAHLKIKYEPDMYVHGGEMLNYPRGVKHLSISVINTGRRPIKVEKAALRIYGDEKMYLLTDSFAEHRPRVLTEENPTTTFFVRQNLIDLRRVYCVVVSDGTGKKHKKYVKKFPTVKLLFESLKDYLKTRPEN